MVLVDIIITDSSINCRCIHYMYDDLTVHSWLSSLHACKKCHRRDPGTWASYRDCLCRLRFSVTAIFEHVHQLFEYRLRALEYNHTGPCRHGWTLAQCLVELASFEVPSQPISDRPNVSHLHVWLKSTKTMPQTYKAHELSMVRNRSQYTILSSYGVR